MRLSTGSGLGISSFIPVDTSEVRSRTVRRIFAMQLGGDKCIWVYARHRGLPWTHSVQRLNEAYSIKPHFLQFPNFCQLTRCLPSSWPGHSASWMRHPAPRTLFQHHLSLKLPQLQKISIQTHLLGTQTEAIIQISTWSLNSFSLFFNFDPTPPPTPSLKRAKTTARQVGQAKQASFVHFCPFSSLLRWGTERPHRLWKAALACKPSFLGDHENSGMELFPPSTVYLEA